MSKKRKQKATNKLKAGLVLCFIATFVACFWGIFGRTAITPAKKTLSTLVASASNILSETPTDTPVPSDMPTATPKPTKKPVDVSKKRIHHATVRGIWISCFDYKSAGLQNKSEEKFRKNAQKMFDRVKAQGFNTVFFHVRSYDDAIWPSKTFKMSKKLVTKGKIKYDPLAILVEEAHRRGLSIHAWMNPYRVSATKILEPARQSTIDRIVKAIKEVAKKYNVDGIHFDDYFYPSNSRYYRRVRTSTKKANTNRMVKACYAAVKKADKTMKFGISPTGNLSYCNTIGADPQTWLRTKGYVDYIVPQIYWSNQYYIRRRRTSYFSLRVNEWMRLNKNKTPIYYGLALYKAGDRNAIDRGWSRSSSNLASQIRELKQKDQKSYVMFSYQNLLKAKCKKEYDNVRYEITKLTLNPIKGKLKIMQTKKLSYTVWPTSVKAKPKFTSSNKAVVAVSQGGTIVAKTNGAAIITATLNGKKASIKVLVTNKE